MKSFAEFQAKTDLFVGPSKKMGWFQYGTCQSLVKGSPGGPLNFQVCQALPSSTLGQS